MKKALRYIWDTQWVLTLLIGLLLGLSYPPFPFPYLQIPAFVLLLRLAERSESGREAAFWSYWAFLIWNIIVTYWLMMATFWGGVAAILANSALMTIPLVLQRLFQRRFRAPALIAVCQASVWLGYEYLHHHWDLAWPWLAVGNAWSQAPMLVQYISFTGYLGISFWILLTSALAYQAVKTLLRRHLAAAILVGLLPPLFSLLIHATQSYQTEKTIEVAVAQPNFDSYQTYGGYGDPASALHSILALSDSVRTPATEAIFWPENAIEPFITNNTRGYPEADRTRQTLDDSVHSWQTTIIGGATYYRFFDPHRAPSLVRTNRSGDKYLYYNAALAFYPGKSYDVYIKANLVPIVERIPFLDFLNTYNIFGIPWNQYPWYGKGVKHSQFRVDGTETPALVCYDSIFPDWIRGFVQEGAGFISIITNDGWWGKTSGHVQHFEYARLRAIEYHRWIVRSANNGISGIITPDGSIKVETRYHERTAFRYPIEVIHQQTFFARYGEWLPQACLLITAIAIGWLIVLRVRS